ncbi:MAG: nucleotidyltransferase domain-containing protein [Cellulosilyticaceae bacterium]
MNQKRKYYTFNKIVESPYALQYVYPIKQRDLSYILEHIPKQVERLYVFGSSLTLDCGIESDIDLLVVAEKTDELYKAFSGIFREITTEVDIIFKTKQEYQDNLSDPTSICTVVEREGLLIYEGTL